MIQASTVKPARSNVKRSGRARATDAFHSRLRSVRRRSVPSGPHTNTSAGASGSLAVNASTAPSRESE